MKLGKYSALTLAIALSAIIVSGCNNKPAIDPDAKPVPSKPINVQLPPTATPEQQAAVQAQMDAARAQGEAYGKWMHEKNKNRK